MPRDPKMLLFDIADAIRLIQQSVGTMDAKRFVDSDEMFRSAIYFQLTIIGEAIGRLRSEDPNAVAALSETHRIIQFRNRLVHGYHEIDDEIVWQIIATKLSVLRAEVEQLIAN